MMEYLTSFGFVKTQLQQQFGFQAALMQPLSRGTVTLSETDPTQVIINPNYLDEPEDKRKLIETFRLARRLANAPALDSWRCFSISPPPWLGSPLKPDCSEKERELDTQRITSHISRFGSGYWHPCGTCKMGSVVDTELNVIGTVGLRVADASVIPHIPRVPIAATVMMIGARCAYLIASSQHPTSKL
uniref:Glucose-methanol-choline oxidoreductase C-terminal domain-containing protein n=1 Tax=Aplanochytrium stocchinoi TaxID=215587 RepID=A0A7S3LKI2_9STRA